MCNQLHYMLTSTWIQSSKVDAKCGILFNMSYKKGLKRNWQSFLQYLMAAHISKPINIGKSTVVFHWWMRYFDDSSEASCVAWSNTLCRQHSCLYIYKGNMHALNDTRKLMHELALNFSPWMLTTRFFQFVSTSYAVSKLLNDIMPPIPTQLSIIVDS